MSEQITLDEFKKLSFNIELVEFEGRPHCLYLDNFRIAGSKPWGGGRTIKRWEISGDDLVQSISEIRLLPPVVEETDPPIYKIRSAYYNAYQYNGQEIKDFPEWLKRLTCVAVRHKQGYWALFKFGSEPTTEEQCIAWCEAEMLLHKLPGERHDHYSLHKVASVHGIITTLRAEHWCINYGEWIEMLPPDRFVECFERVS